jgi:hypothetical protein
MRALWPIAALSAAVVALYGSCVGLWWTWDDAYLLRLTLSRPLADYILSPEFWRAQPNQHFFPLYLMAAEASLVSAGLDASRFYALNLAAIIGLGAALYGLLRLWLPRRDALAGAALFVIGTPMCELATRVSSMNYFHALILAMAAIAVHVIGVRRNSIWLAVGSGALYLAALLAKEVVLPLPLILLLLPERPSAASLVPPLEALAIFFAARTVMLGAAITSYGFAMTPAEWLPLAALTPWHAWRAVLGPDPMVAVALAAILLAIILPALRDRRFAVAAVSAVGISIAMMLPVAKAFEQRHLVLLWMATAILFVIAARGRWRWLAAAALLALIANRGQWQIEFASSFRQSSEGHAYFALGPGAVLAYPSIPPAAMQELRWLKESWRGLPAGADWFYDDLYLCEGRGTGLTFVSWRPDTRAVEPMIPEPRCGQARVAPMTLAFHHRDDKLFWTFGPYGDGGWHVIMDDGRQSFAVPAEDGFHLPGVRALSLRVRYDSPEGWRTYSPVLALDFAREPRLTFTR